MYVDAIQDYRKDLIKVVERINGKRIYREFPAVCEFYEEHASGDVPTIYGTKSIKRRFHNSRDMKREAAELKSMGIRLFESDCNALFKTLSEVYQNEEPPELNICFFDIETGFSDEFGYAPIHDPFNPVISIQLFKKWSQERVILVLRPKTVSKLEAAMIYTKLEKELHVQFIECETEIEMFEKFFDHISDADVLSGWNSEAYDIPYLVNRSVRLMGAGAATHFCLWMETPREKEIDHFGKMINTYELVGRIHLDYLQLYKKHAGQVEQSYSLDYIGGKVTKEHKVAYTGSLWKLYLHNYETFLRYGAQDTELLEKIDNVMDFINLHNRMAHDENVLLSTTMGSVALIDTAIINQAHRRGEVVFDKKPSDEGEEQVEFSDEYFESEDFEEAVHEEMASVFCTAKAAGAWVQDPVVGLHRYLGCTDFNSLYPTVLRTLGMSTECILGQIRQDYTEKYLSDKIEEQRRKSKSKKFQPDWTAAWHGLFASVEFTMVKNRTEDLIYVDLENGTSFQCTARELHDKIYAPDSNIVISANGTLFDRTRAGVIPEILTRWYTERKAQQKMVITYKHLYFDGFPVANAEVVAALNARLGMKHTGSGTLVRETLHTNDPVYHLNKAVFGDDVDSIIDVIEKAGFVWDGETGRIWGQERDHKFCKQHSAFWKQNQQIRKILLNSLYGALLNKGSRFYDRRLGQSVTLTGRSMTKHMASKLNEIVTGEYNHHGGVVVYGDTDSVYFSLDTYYKSIGVPFNLTRDEVIPLYVRLGEEMGKDFPRFMDEYFNTGVEKGKIVGADLEMVGLKGLFLKKKRYAILKYWEDGFRKDIDGELGELKAMGIEIKRSDTPKYIQDFLKTMMIDILAETKTEDELRKNVVEFKRTFNEQNSWLKGSPRSIRKLAHWTTIYQQTNKCSVGHVNAAIQWNKLRELNHDVESPIVEDGSKVMVCKLRSNVHGIKVIGYPIEQQDNLPEWFKDLPFDDTEMEKTILTKKMHNIFGSLGMDLGLDICSGIVDDHDIWGGW